ncbi:MAG: hypothetical protein ACKVI6_03310 [Candidatus Poseidoniales archaeon]|jgi:ribosome-binding protein aMBF1 (putative translation factor)
MLSCSVCGMSAQNNQKCQLCGGEIKIITASIEGKELKKNDDLNEQISSPKIYSKINNNNNKSLQKIDKIKNQKIILPFGIENAPQYTISLSLPFGIQYAPK